MWPRWNSLILKSLIIVIIGSSHANNSNSNSSLINLLLKLNLLLLFDQWTTLIWTIALCCIIIDELSTKFKGCILYKLAIGFIARTV